MIFAMPVLFIPIRLFNLKKIISAVIIKDAGISFLYGAAVFIDLGLYKIRFLSNNFQSSLNMLQLKSRRL